MRNAKNTKLLLRLIVVLACAFFHIAPLAAQSWSNGYAFRRAITINSAQVSNTDQINFPVLISGTYSFLATSANGGGVINPNGFDIIFTSDAAGANVLPFEQESYAASTGVVNYWVQVSDVSASSNTVIYMFYGNGSVTTSQSNRTAVWDSNFVSVWHLSQNPTGTAPQLSDSTTNANNGTAQGSWSNSQRMSGPFGGGLNFNASNDDYISTTNSFNSPENETLEIWFNSSSTSGTKLIGFENAQTGASGSYDRQIWLGTNGKVYGGFYSCTFPGSLVSTSTYNDGNWHQAALVLDTSAHLATLYVDGSQAATPVSCSSAVSYTGYFKIGAYSLGSWTSANSGFFSGGLDEARISLSVRSADWIATEYRNESSPSTFYSVGAPDVNGLGGASTPYIAEISPTSGPVTVPVTVLGANFGSTQGSSTLTFNGVATSASVWTNSVIVAPVPLAATSGNVVVTVSGQVSNPASFTVTAAPAITGMSPSSGIAGTQVAISGVNFGSSQGSSTVTLSGSTCTVVSWSSTSIAVIVPSGTASGPFTVTVGGQPTNSATFTVLPLPAPWQDQDIGAIGIAGTANYASNVFTVKGGNSGINNSSDSFHFVYQPLSGDGSIVARVASIQGGYYPQIGVMIRETLSASATNAFAYFSSGSAYFCSRSTTGGSTSCQYASMAGVTNGSSPFWVELARNGNSFTVNASPDGVNWIQVGTSQTVTMAESVYAGLAASSDYSTVSVTATFDTVAVNSASPAAPPLITGVSATTGSVGSKVTITGTGFGIAQGNSLVYLNDVPVTVNSWSDTSISVTIPSGATTGLLMVSVAPDMNDSNGVRFEVTSQPLPAAWLDQDVGLIGQVGLAGSATSSNGVFVVQGAGQGIYSTSDAMHFVYQPLSGDGSIVARVARIQGGGQVGVMIRETLEPNSASAFVYFYPSQAYLMCRPSAGANTNQYAANFSAANTYYPYWVMLTRSGNTFTAYVSVEGTYWIQISSQSITMAQNAYIGLAVSSESTTSLTTATFDGVSISSAQSVTPSIANISATTGPVGSQVTIYGSSFGSSQTNNLVVLNDAPVTVNSWGDTVITITIPSGATSGYLEVLTGDSLNSSNPVVFTVTSQPLLAGWLDADIGANPTPGSATYSGGTFTVNSSGAGVGGQADGLHFVYQPLVGDGVIIAQVSNMTNGSVQSAELGVMIRETLAAGATNAFVWFYPYSAVANFSVRTTTGGNTTQQNQSFGSPSYPYWVKIARTGSAFEAYVSQDGSNWTQVGTSQSITMAQTVYIGLAAASPPSSALLTATFNSTSIALGTMPIITGTSPGSGGPGSQVTINGLNFGSAQGTSSVKFNGTSTTSIASWTNNQIVANFPSGATSGPVTVIVNGIQSNMNFSFTLYNPVVTSISPSTAQAGATVTVVGSGFGVPTDLYVTSEVIFNGTPTGDIISWSDTSITVRVPNGATTGPLTVVEGGVTSNGVVFNVEPLSITGVSPSSAAAGSLVTISGTGFGASQSSSTLDFAGTTASIQSWSDTQIVAIVPQGANSGSVNATVGLIRWFGPHFTMSTTTQVTDSKSNQSSYTSALIGGIWVSTVGQGSGCSTCTQRGNVSYTYDSSGHILTRTDENGNTTTYTYDSNGNVLTVTVPISSGNTATTTYTYNNFGEVLSATDPLGFVTANTYDPHGNLLSVTTPAPGNGASASVTQFAYNTLGELTKITDPNSNSTSLTFTSMGLVQTITDAQSNVTTYGYDSRGNRTSVTDANNKQTTFTYDAMNRLTKITYPDSTTTQFGYDYRGRRTSVTDQNGKTTSYAYDDADRLITVTDAATNVTTYGYDTESNLTSIQDASHNTTYFAYDAFGRVTQTTFPSGYIETYGYDNVGNLTSKTDRKNQLVTYTYDQLNRLTEKSYPDTSTVNYTYDNDSRLTQVTDPTGTYQFTFDNMGRLTGTSTQYAFLTSRTFTTSYSYDAASNRVGFTDPESGSTSYAYDTLNRLQTLTAPTAISSGSFGFGYDALSRRTSLTRPNSVNTSYSYDNLSRLLSITHAKGGATLDGASYTLDNAGNRTAKNDLYANVTTNYGYDNIYELLSAAQSGTTTESYTFDAVGNRLTTIAGSWTNNTSNELITRPSASYTYDYNGNTQTMVNSSGTTTYSWDFESRLTSVALPNGGGTVYFKYDPFGRRIYKSSAVGTSIYAYDGDNLVEETNASGAVAARYSQGLNIDEPLAMLRSGTTSYYEADGSGSLTSLSNTAGAVANAYTYDSFGNLVASSGSIVNNFRYTGREWDPETSLYYYRARYYDPQSGRFISEDPIGFAAGPNFYEYVLNKPMNLTDPFGNNPISVALPWLGGFGEATLPAWLGPGIAIGGAGAVGWGIGRGIGHLPIGDGQSVDDAVQAALLNLILLAERTIPNPARPRCGCTCTCRADADDTMPGNIRPGLPRFAFGTATASNCAEASKDAKRIATQNLGMKPKHIPCKCAGD